MSTLDPTQAAIWRTHGQTEQSWIWIDNPPIVLAAQVNVINPFPTSAFSVHNITSGAVADCLENMLILLGTAPGLDDLGRVLVQSVDGSIITIPLASQGTEDGTLNAVSGNYVTVLDFYPGFTWTPYIGPDGTSFKNGNLPYNPYGLHPPPIANINGGCGWMDIVDPLTDVITIKWFDSSGSYTTDPQSSGSFTAIWDMGDGTFIDGTNVNSAQPHVTFPVGRRYIKLTVLDNTNSVIKVRRMLVVACKEGDPDFSPINDFAVSTPLTQKVEGLSISFDVYEDIPPSSYPDGMMVIYTKYQYYGATQDNLNSRVVKFAGFHRTDPAKLVAQDKDLSRTTTLDCLDVCGMMNTLPGFPQTLENNAALLRWEQFFNPNMDDYFRYLWLWHSTGSTICDFYDSGTGVTYPFTRLASGGESLYKQIDDRARAIGYRMLGDALGRIRIKLDPLLAEVADRPSAYTVLLNDGDWEEIGYTHQRWSNSHWNRGSAILASGTTVAALFCIAPGPRPAMGLSETTHGENLCVSQDELNNKTGQAFARENSDYGLWSMKLTSGGDAGFEPLDFFKFTLDVANTTYRDLSFTAKRFLCDQVATETDNEYGTDVVTLTGEWETFGTPAATVIPAQPDNVQPTQVPLTPFIPQLNTNTTGPDAYALNGVIKALALINTDGYVYQCLTNFNTGTPTYVRASLGVSGTPCGAVGDPFCVRYQGGVAGSEVDAWVVTTTGIYFVTHIEGTPSATLQKSLSHGTTALRSIQMEFGTQYLIVVTSAYSDGVYETHSTNGTTWSAEARLGTANAGSYTPGLAVSTRNVGTIYTSAMTGAATADGYGSVNSGTSYAALTNPAIDPGADLAGEIHLPYNGNPSDRIVYYGRTQGVWTHDFDLTHNNGGFTNEVYGPGRTPSTAGVYIPSTGWEQTGPIDGGGVQDYTSLFIGVNLPSAATLTKIEYTFDRAVVNSGPDTIVEIIGKLSGTLIVDQASSSPGPIGTAQTYAWTGSQSLDRLVYNTNVGQVSHPGSPGGTVTLTHLHIEGTGVSPYGGSATGRVFVQANGTVNTLLSPILGGTSFGPYQSRQIDSCAANRAFMVMVGGDNTQTNVGVWVSNNGFATSQVLVPPNAAANRFERAAMSGSLPVIVYLMGKQGNIAISTNGTTVIDKRGNIASFTPGTNIQVLGL